MQIISYLFDPLPPAPAYSDAQALPFLVMALGLLAASFFLSRWSRRHANPITKKLSKSWPKMTFTFGFVALILVVSRVESIQYIAMRFWWVLWAVLGVLLASMQYRVFQSRHYSILPSETVVDPRSAYLPKRKKK